MVLQEAQIFLKIILTFDPKPGVISSNKHAPENKDERVSPTKQKEENDFEEESGNDIPEADNSEVTSDDDDKSPPPVIGSTVTNAERFC